VYLSFSGLRGPFFATIGFSVFWTPRPPLFVVLLDLVAFSVLLGRNIGGPRSLLSISLLRPYFSYSQPVFVISALQPSILGSHLKPAILTASVLKPDIMAATAL
jgi:hypothetical protein